MIKKTCNGCYAADTGSHPKFGQPHGCLLAYQTDGQGHPAEACPKPKSWKQLKNIEKERAQIMDEKKNQEFPQDGENNEYRY